MIATESQRRASAKYYAANTTSAEIKTDRIKDLSCRINKNTKLLEKRTELERKAWKILGEDNPDMKKYYSIMMDIDRIDLR